MSTFTNRCCGAMAVVVTGTLLLSACGAGDSSKLSLHDRLPKTVRDSGVLKVGASFTAAPMIFRNPQGEPDGLDPDLAAALEKALGIKFEFQDVGPFSNVLPGLLAKKYDIAFSGITDTREREHGLDATGRQVNDGFDFVDYFMAGVGIVVRKGNPNNVTKLDDLCGRTAAVKKGTIHDDLATRQQQACDHIGKPLTVVKTDTDPQALDNVHGGQADAYLTDYPKGLYNAQVVDGGKAFELAGPQLQPRPYGIAVRKADSQLRDILAKAVNSLVLDGTYDSILAKRQLTVGAIQNSVVNGSNS